MQLHYRLRLDGKVAAYIWIRWILLYILTRHGSLRKVLSLSGSYIYQNLTVAEAGAVVQTADAAVPRLAKAHVAKIMAFNPSHP